MNRRTPLLALLLALAGCDSPSHLASQPLYAPAAQAVHATRAADGGATAITIDDVAALPEPVRGARDLKVAVGAVRVPVTRLATGYLAFSLPAGVVPPQDVAGNLQVLFVIDDARSVLVPLATGSPIRFADPPVRTSPADGGIAFGLDVYLEADTAADEAAYRFDWAAAPTAQGPWQPVPGEGKRLKWTPAAPGNYFIHVDAVAKATGRAWGATSSAAAVRVSTPKDIITTDPAAGALPRGNRVTLRFNRPAGLTGTALTYAWSQGPSAQGPWAPVGAIGSPTAAAVAWLPTELGSYFVRVDAADAATGAIQTFVSPQAVVFVTEDRPIITPERGIVKRGDAVRLTFNGQGAGEGPYAWYTARVAAPAGTAPSQAGGPPAWVPLVGEGRTIETIATDAGTYAYRVDVPQPDGAMKGFTTTNPVLSVTEPAQLVHSDPPFNAIVPTGSTSLVLDAAGIVEGQYHLVWSVSQNPQLGFTPMPYDGGNRRTAKRYTVTSKTTAMFQPGAYYVKVDATTLDGSRSYAFVSSAPAFTVTRQDER